MVVVMLMLMLMYSCISRPSRCASDRLCNNLRRPFRNCWAQRGQRPSVLVVLLGSGWMSHLPPLVPCSASRRVERARMRGKPQCPLG
ncbi:hypothetical protein BGZ60DRAFT_273068 [Tricladium varicosporioides]|nr:hypothetical protein BGZ60DRAFT_273068 [Hymenoscyphus varicosporioides]